MVMRLMVMMMSVMLMMTMMVLMVIVVAMTLMMMMMPQTCDVHDRDVGGGQEDGGGDGHAFLSAPQARPVSAQNLRPQFIENSAD